MALVAFAFARCTREPMEAQARNRHDPIELSSEIPSQPAPDDPPVMAPGFSVAPVGGEFVTAWMEESSAGQPAALGLSRLTPAGVRLDRPPRRVEVPWGTGSIALGPQRGLLVRTGPSGFEVARSSYVGALEDPTPVPLGLGSASGYGSVAAWGNDFARAWTEYASDGGLPVYLARINASGAQPIVTGRTKVGGSMMGACSVAVAGDTVAIATRDYFWPVIGFASALPDGGLAPPRPLLGGWPPRQPLSTSSAAARRRSRRAPPAPAACAGAPATSAARPGPSAARP